MSKKITLQQFGMSEEFRKRSFPLTEKKGEAMLGEPMFYEEEGQMYQNPKCQISGVDFLKLYKELC